MRPTLWVSNSKIGGYDITFGALISTVSWFAFFILIPFFSLGAILTYNVYLVYNTACSSLMRALEECQKKGFINKALGRCSSLRQELNICLDQTTQARRRRKIIRKKAERKKFEEKKKQMYEEEYGKDGYLKKVIEKEYELKHGKKPDGTPASRE